MSRRALDHAWRDEVLRRGWYRCRLEALNRSHECHGPLEAHHIGQVSTHPHLRLDPTNGVVLCRSGHRWVHEHIDVATQWGLLRRGET